MCINTHRAQQRLHRWIIDQTNGQRTPHGFGADGREQIRFIVIRHRQNSIAAFNIGLRQHICIQPIPMKDDCFFQQFSCLLCGEPIFLDHLGADATAAIFKVFGHRKPNITAAHNNDTVLHMGGFAKDFKRPLHIMFLHKDIARISRKELVARARNKQRAIAPNGHHHRGQC